MKITLTICSNEKDRSSELLPAYKRYTSQRITTVRAIAKKKTQPFYILSGKYGLVAENDPIPYYDHLLTNDEVKKMTDLVSQQLRQASITAIEFYAKPRQGNWTPYYEVLENAIKREAIAMRVIPYGS